MVPLFLLVGCNLSYIVDLFAALHELASASARTLLKLASSVRARLKPYWATLKQKTKPLENNHYKLNQRSYKAFFYRASVLKYKFDSHSERTKTTVNCLDEIGQRAITKKKTL